MHTTKDFLTCYSCSYYSSVQSGVNIKANKICEDQIRPHLLKCYKSGDFNEFSLSKSVNKTAHCQEKRLNLIYFAITDFHGYCISAKIKI